MRDVLPEMSHRLETVHLSPLSALAANRLIGGTATMMVGMFFPIFLFEFVGMQSVVYFLVFACIYLFRLPFYILAAKTFHIIGLRVAMAIGTVGWASYYGLVHWLDVGTAWPNLILACAILGLTVLHVFYWAPFHTDFATFSKKGSRGRELGLFFAIKLLLGVAAPVIGGWLIATFAYSAAFLAGVALVLLSLIPLMLIPDVPVKYEFSFVQSIKELFARDERPMTVAMFAHGVESMVAYSVWPVFLFLVLDGAYLSVGIFAALIVIVNVLLQLSVGKLIDAKHLSKKMLRWGADVYALGWLGKAVVSSVGGVFAAATFHGFGGILLQTPWSVLTYQKAADAGHYIDEFTVLREMMLTVGRVTLLLLMALLSVWFPIQIAFVLAALATVFMSIFAKYRVQALAS